jgi:hypothetical protein
VTPDQVVEAFDEGEHRHPGLGLGSEAAPVQEFALEGGEEGFRHGVVIAAR